MILANILTIAAAAVLLVASAFCSLKLCIPGLCLAGLSYGSCPTFTSAFTADFYGRKYFSSNFSIMNFNLMGAALIASPASMLLGRFGSFTAPFLMLLAFTMLALVLNLSIRRP